MPFHIPVVWVASAVATIFATSGGATLYGKYQEGKSKKALEDIDASLKRTGQQAREITDEFVQGFSDRAAPLQAAMADMRARIEGMPTGPGDQVHDWPEQVQEAAATLAAPYRSYKLMATEDVDFVEFVREFNDDRTAKGILGLNRNDPARGLEMAALYFSVRWAERTLDYAATAHERRTGMDAHK